MLPLFKSHPLLQENLPYVSLGEFPTPIEKLEGLGQAIDASNLYAKREDLSGKLSGGNKVRALEFLLGDALQAGVPAFLRLVKYRLQHGRFPKFLEASSPLGMVGYVNAGFELKDQIERGLLPEPDLVMSH